MHKITIKLISILLLLSSFFTFTAAPALAAVTYLYDANGNMTSDGTNCYTYNEGNNLTQVKNCNTNQLIAEYSYDDQGNRGMQKIYQNGVLVQTIYTPYKDFETTKIASTGATQNTSYYTVTDQIVARKNSDGTKTYYHDDNLNSTNVLTNQAGQLVEKTTYYPFGGIQSGGTQSKFLYTGQQQDSQTGLDYYNARYYNPQIRRFTQPDTLIPDAYNPQTLNRYSYVVNNPLKYTDPSGHCFWDACVVESLVITAGIAALASYFVLPPVKTSVNNALNFLISTEVKGISNTYNAVKNVATTQTKDSSVNTKNSSTPNSSQGPNSNNPINKLAPIIPAAATSVAQQIRDNGGKALSGYASRIFENREELLPKAGEYIEHDIYPYVQGMNRGAERLVIDTISGKTWYSSDHYQSFIEILEKK